MPPSSTCPAVAAWASCRPYGRGSAARTPPWRRPGWRRRLTAELRERARAGGVTRLLAEVATDNRRVIAWIARAGGVPEARDHDAIRFSIPLDATGAAR